MNYIRSLFFILLITNFSTYLLSTADDIASILAEYVDEADDDMDDLINAVYNDVQNDPENWYYKPKDAIVFLTRKPCPDVPEDVNIELQTILQEDLYLHTYPLSSRPLNDLPQFQYTFGLPRRCQAKKKYYYHFFYNQTSKMNYTQESTSINSYLAFNNSNLIDRFDRLGQIFEVSVPRVLSLFENLKIQERRAGFMFGLFRRRNNWVYEFRMPIVYQIRNFFLNDTEKKAIENEPLFDDGDPSTDNDAEVTKFAREHLISDRIGFGDSRLNIGYLAIDNCSHTLITGFETTLPTAAALWKGLYGNSFKKNNNHPPFNLLTILNLAFPTHMQNIDQAIEITRNFLIGALDKLSSILVDDSLGNRGHIGVGVFGEHYMCVTPKLTFYTRAELEYLIPSVEKRFFIFKKDRAQFLAIDPDPENEECTQNLAFLNEQLINTLYPSVFNTMVHPGLIFKINTALSGTMGKNWQLMLGHDLWWHQKEKLGRINLPKVERKKLRKDIAARPGAIQTKVFGSINYLKKGDCRDWCVSLYGDAGLLGSGIGTDFSMGMRVELLW